MNEFIWEFTALSSFAALMFFTSGFFLRANELKRQRAKWISQVEDLKKEIQALEVNRKLESVHSPPPPSLLPHPPPAPIAPIPRQESYALALKEELALTRKKVAELTSSIVNHQEIIGQSRESEQSAKREVTKLQTELDRLRIEKASLSNKAPPTGSYASVSQKSSTSQPNSTDTQNNTQSDKLQRAFDRSRQELKKTREQLDRMVSENRKNRVKTQNLSSELRTAKTELATALKSRQEVEAQLAQAGSRLSALESHSARAAHLQEEVLELRAQLLNVSQSEDSMEEFEDLKRESQAMRLQIRTLEEHLSNSNDLAEENTRLKMELDLAKTTLVEIDKLREELANYQSSAFALSAQPPVPEVDSSDPATTVQGTFSERLNTRMDELIQHTNCQVAVVADPHGFLVWGVGDDADHESLAALSAEGAMLGEHARSLLPLGHASSLTITDTNGITLHSRYLGQHDQQLSLTMLGAYSTNQDQKVEKRVNAIHEIVKELHETDES